MAPVLTYSLSTDIFINIGKRLITTIKKKPHDHYIPPLLFRSKTNEKEDVNNMRWKKVAQEIHKFFLSGISLAEDAETALKKSQHPLTATLKLEKPVRGGLGKLGAEHRQ